nr:nitroreductase family deazaflavin-dependent oxidoreductase [Fodinicola acaciae]
MSRSVARFNKRGLNRVTGPLGPWLPGFAVVVHRGRKSGATYRTPVNYFRTSHGYVFALTYGSEADWVRNVLAAGGCQLHVRSRFIPLTAPRLYEDPARSDMPLVVRLILGRAKVTEFLELQPR